MAEQTYISRSSDSVRMFDSDLVESLSRVHPATPFVIYLPFIAGSLYLAFSRMQLFRHRRNVANYFPRRSSHGFSIDSRITFLDIFECPARRSVNVIGISTIRRLSCCARKTVST